ncbi:MAG: flagellar basal body P-ring formation chaperone FlgA [Phenylobacterium sp.]|uniref:flagellar basal body P-ring formation chaperone FlgA n=1 Tax=Phenylobacterium sp. TaxID=1871053 RepID=UPI0027203130|nr:flagellar basal body P-ring formation chaperone FlgA [Phenylobacterium sp.]MDO8902723.1 flagellar basal body P-ring formation chaperone FlgA [Phenylobacterium sp.]MDP2212991.1 flagellar basal body P-ring formation chaperone FlgA [Phenylobacterium sp.]
MLRSFALAAALWLGAAAIAQAAIPVTLKAETVSADGVVTLGDLFDGAGSASGVRVAAKPGLSVVLDAGAVQQLARRAGLDWSNETGIRRIVVRSGASGGTAAAAARPGNVEVLTYARSLAAGDIVQPEDLIWAKAAMAPSDAPRDAEDIVGLATRRPLRAGSAVSARDVSAPQVIAAGDIVTLTYEAAGMMLSVKAKAMGRAALGEGFAAQNLTSKRTVQAVATGPGQAAVGPGADQILASPAARYALR